MSKASSAAGQVRDMVSCGSSLPSSFADGGARLQPSALFRARVLGEDGCMKMLRLKQSPALQRLQRAVWDTSFDDA